jgi:putative transposase
MADLSTFSDEAWQEAKRRAEVIRPLAARQYCPRLLVRAAAQDLKLSERQVYALVKRCRLSNGAMDALIPSVSSGGRGGSRIGNDKEDLVHELIYCVYLSSQRLSAEAFIREVRRCCHLAGLIPPSASTVRRRLKRLSPEERKLRGDLVAPTTAVSGRTPIPRFPLDAVQIDHTKVDVILVDPADRRPIGRPWLTVAIDIYSRCIAGIHVTLEAPRTVTDLHDYLTYLADLGMRRTDLQIRAPIRP